MPTLKLTQREAEILADLVSYHLYDNLDAGDKIVLISLDEQFKKLLFSDKSKEN
jgi:hypothetical protein